MKIKKVHCLVCDTILEVDFDKTSKRKKYDDSYAECGCSNNTTLTNYFTISQPGSIVTAIDKSKVKAQALQDCDFCKKDEWFYLVVPDDENTPRYTKWHGAYGGINCDGFLEGVGVNFTTETPMTFNECRTYLKTNKVYGVEGQIYHLISHLEDKKKEEL